uniref:Immunoglobulin V-set domain-containing protein n=1 Tax=Equus asinus TaxID=9793 RepID=A0A9L0K158_EQUAS
MSLLEAFTFLSFWAVGLGLTKVEQSQISISTEVKKSINIHCKITSSDFAGEYIHWYRQKPKKALEHLIYVSSTKSPARANLGGKKNKLEARKDSQTSTSVLAVNFIENEDVRAQWLCHCPSSRHPETLSKWARFRERISVSHYYYICARQPLCNTTIIGPFYN